MRGLQESQLSDKQNTRNDSCWNQNVFKEILQFLQKTYGSQRRKEIDK